MRSLQTLAALLVCSLTQAAVVRAGDGESSFTPTSLYVPVRFVLLQHSTSNLTSPLYRCPSERDPSLPPDAGSDDRDAGATPTTTLPADSDAGAPAEVLDDDCLVDMADNAALAALFSDKIDIAPGTYDQIVISQCRAGEHGYASFVKGQISLSGQTLYTTSGGSTILTTVRADNRHVRLEYGGCGSTIKLPAPVTLAAGDTVDINAFFSLRNIAWAMLANEARPGGCAFDEHNQNVCTGYPIPIAYLGTVAPTLDTYYITEDQSDLDARKASGQLLILRTREGQPFGGFSRRLYSASSIPPSVNYDTPLKTLTPNPDGLTYLIENYGGGSNGVAVPFYVRFPAFELHTHNGTMTRSDGVTMVDYRAVLQP